jgi:hypothetical protein
MGLGTLDKIEYFRIRTVSVKGKDLNIFAGLS